MPELCYLPFVCKKLKNSQQVLYVALFQNVLFQLRDQASRMRALVIASGECWVVFSLAANRIPFSRCWLHHIRNSSAWFVLFLWSVVPSWGNTLSYRSPWPLWALPWLPNAVIWPETQGRTRWWLSFPTCIPLSLSHGPGHVLLCPQQVVCPWVSPGHHKVLKHRMLVFKVYISSM